MRDERIPLMSSSPALCSFILSGGSMLQLAAATAAPSAPTGRCAVVNRSGAGRAAGGLTTAQLQQAGLPTGFDQTVWAGGTGGLSLYSEFLPGRGGGDLGHGPIHRGSRCRGWASGDLCGWNVAGRRQRIGRCQRLLLCRRCGRTIRANRKQDRSDIDSCGGEQRRRLDLHRRCGTRGQHTRSW